MRKLWLIFSQTVTVALAVMFVVATLKPEWLRRPPWALMDTAPPVVVKQTDMPAGKGVAAPYSFSAAARRERLRWSVW